MVTPPQLKAVFSRDPVLLSHARFIGEFLPPVPIGKEHLQLLFFAIAAILYWPLLFIAEIVTSLLYPLIDSFYPVTHRIWSAVIVSTFSLFCIPIAATSVWLFYEKSFGNSLLTVCIVLFLFFFFFALWLPQIERR
jgi:hypothetical protein